MFTLMIFFLFSEELMQKTFCTFGPIQEVRVFKDKGYAFIRLVDSHRTRKSRRTLQNKVRIKVFRPFSRALTGPIFGPIPNAKLKVFFPIEKINSQLKKIKHILIKINQINIELESCKTCSSSLKYDVYTLN